MPLLPGLLSLALAASAVPARAPPVAHLSPDRRYLVTMVRDDAFGQVETLLVFADPNTPRARRIFRHVGDTPLRFLRWRDGATAELEFPLQGGTAAHRLVLSCGGEACRLEEG